MRSYSKESFNPDVATDATLLFFISGTKARRVLLQLLHISYTVSVAGRFAMPRGVSDAPNLFPSLIRLQDLQKETRDYPLFVDNNFSPFKT